MLQPFRPDTLLRKGLKLSHLRLLAALAETEQLTLAAAAIGISQPAASRLVAEIEAIIGGAVHERTGRGIGLTAMGRALSLRAQRVRLELDDAARDMAEIMTGGMGHVRIGTVTGAALDRVLPALQREQARHPSVTVEVEVAASDQLCDHLLAGRLDFVLGRMPEGPQAQMLTYAPLDGEPLALVARHGHPVLTGAPTLEAALSYDWLLPGEPSLMTRTVLASLQARGLPAPRRRVSTTSFMLTLALLQQTDAIAVLAQAIARQFSTGPDAALATLPVPLGIEVEPYGMISRERVALTPAAQRLADQVSAGHGPQIP